MLLATGGLLLTFAPLLTLATVLAGLLGLLPPGGRLGGGVSDTAFSPSSSSLQTTSRLSSVLRVKERLRMSSLVTSPETLPHWKCLPHLGIPLRSEQ